MKHSRCSRNTYWINELLIKWVNGCTFFLERYIFFEKSRGVEDSMGTPPRSHSDAAIPQLFWVVADSCPHLSPSRELSSEADRCLLPGRVKSPCWFLQPISDWHWDTKVNLLASKEEIPLGVMLQSFLSVVQTKVWLYLGPNPPSAMTCFPHSLTVFSETTPSINHLYPNPCLRLCW